MKTYPELYYPKELEKILQKENFEKPKAPKSPKFPYEPTIGKILIGIFSIIVGICMGGFAFTLTGIIVGIIFFILFKIDLSEYENDRKKYSVDLKIYNKDLKMFYEATLLNQIQFNKLTKKNKVMEVLKSTTPPTLADDYLKGASHEYFSEFLYRRFGSKIIEDATVLTDHQHELRAREDNYDYYGYNNSKIKRTYISDFAFFDKASNLCIAIEIDEPYTILEKKPIHLDDTKRNNFFINHGWIVLRFAEVQVIDYPEHVCNIIENLVKNILINNSLLKDDIISSNIDNFILNKWDIDQANYLVSIKYREECLKRIETNSNKLFDLNQSIPPNSDFLSIEDFSDIPLINISVQNTKSDLLNINRETNNLNSDRVTSNDPVKSKSTSRPILFLFLLTCIILIFIYINDGFWSSGENITKSNLIYNDGLQTDSFMTTNKNTVWYQDDPLFNLRNDNMIHLFNRPYSLLQDYYDCFQSLENLENKLSQYYSDTLIVHHGEYFINKKFAVKNLYNNYLTNNIKTCESLVDLNKMVTNKYNFVDIVTVPVIQYITYNDGNRNKYTQNITAVLDKENLIILGIGEIFNFDDIINTFENNPVIKKHNTMASLFYPKKLPQYAPDIKDFSEGFSEFHTENLLNEISYLDLLNKNGHGSWVSEIFEGIVIETDYVNNEYFIEIIEGEYKDRQFAIYLYPWDEVNTSIGNTGLVWLHKILVPGRRIQLAWGEEGTLPSRYFAYIKYLPSPQH